MECKHSIQPVFDHYKALVYMCGYMSKSKDQCSQAMKHAVQDAMENKLAIYDQMRSIVHTYLNERESSIQECVYQCVCLSGQSLRKAYPRVIFSNKNLPKKGFRICQKIKCLRCQIIY